MPIIHIVVFFLLLWRSECSAEEWEGKDTPGSPEGAGWSGLTPGQARPSAILVLPEHAVFWCKYGPGARLPGLCELAWPDGASSLCLSFLVSFQSNWQHYTRPGVIVRIIWANTGKPSAQRCTRNACSYTSVRKMTLGRVLSLSGALCPHFEREVQHPQWRSGHSHAPKFKEDTLLTRDTPPVSPEDT